MTKQGNTYVRIALSTILVVYGVTVSIAQGTQPTSSPLLRRVNLNYHLGSVELPEGFSGYVTANWTDAWAGYIKSEDGSFTIGWAVGTIQYISEKRKKDIVWQKEEKTLHYSYRLSLLRDKQGETMVARIGWLEFDAKVQSKDDEELFLSIVGSFRKERCTTCHSLPHKTAY